MLTQTQRALTDDERYLLLAQRNRATDAGRRSHNERIVGTTLGTLAGIAFGLILAAGLRTVGLSEAACRLVAIVVATSGSVLAYESAARWQRRTLEQAIQEATDIDRILADGQVYVYEVHPARAASLVDDSRAPDEEGWLFDLGAEGTLYIRADANVVPSGFPSDAFRFAVGDGRGAIDEEIEVFGPPLEPVVGVVYKDLGTLCDRSLYPVPFDDAVADPACLTPSE